VRRIMLADNIHKYIVHRSVLLKYPGWIFDSTVTSSICLCKQIGIPSVQIFDISFVEIGGVTDPHCLSSSKRSEIRNDFEYFADSHPRY
jgi:hypothetical protein